MEETYGYFRVSGKGQVKGDGFPRQLQAIKSHLTDHNLRIVRIFRDEGVSGAVENMDRPAWRDRMAALHSDGVRTVVIEKLDRLARDLMVQEAAIADLQKNGVNLISAAEPDMMASEATRIFMCQLLGAVGQSEKNQIVAKLRGARLRK